MGRGVTAVTPPAAGPDDPQPGRLPGGRGRSVKVTLLVGSSIVVAGARAAVAAARHESVSSRRGATWLLPSLSLQIRLPRVISTPVLRERADEDNDDPLLSAGR